MQQFLKKQQLKYNIMQWCFLRGPCKNVITRRVWSNNSVVGYSPESNDVSTEAEETPLLEATTRKPFVETVTD
jgi:hypothetical protein